MQKIILFIAIVFLQTTSYSQKQHVGGSCANEMVPYSKYPQSGTLIHPKSHYAMAGMNSVPVKLHVLRSNSGTTSFSQADFINCFMELNRTFRSVNIQFYLLPDINYIDNTLYYDLNADDEEADLCDNNDVSDAVNLYLTNSIVFGLGFNATGYAYYPSPIAASNRVFVTNSAMTTGGRTLIHEFGHYFNLLHTFRGNRNLDVNTRELVTRGSGANCLLTGDFLCDTPSDPYGLAGASTNGCTYTGTLTDANGMQFSPQMSNTMSYYSEVCGEGFTADQFDRLAEGYTFRNAPVNQYDIVYSDPGVAAPTGLTASASQAGILLTYTDNATNEIGYIIERATSSAGPFEPVTTAMENATSLIDQDLLPNTTFYYRVRAVNGIEYTNVASATTGTFYCQPTYQQSCNDFMVVIEQFSIHGTALSNINSGCSPNNYGKITNMVADLEKGNSYTFTSSATTTMNVPYYEQFLSIWVDFDQDGDFSASEMVFQSTTNTGMNPTASETINVPLNARTGLTTLRARTQYSSFGSVTDPCNELVMGETEDYVVNITSAFQTNTIEITSINPQAVCLGSTMVVNYNTVGADFSGNTGYVVQLEDAAGQFINLSTQSNGVGSLSATIPPSFASGADFNVRILATNPNVSSSVNANKVTIQSKPSAPIITINKPSTTVCLGTSVSLNAVGCTQNVIWSNNMTVNPITISVNQPISITATCVTNGCVGEVSAPVNLSTKPLPVPPTVVITNGGNASCIGDNITLTANGCNGVVNWNNGSTGNTLSFTASVSVSLSATCTIDECQSDPSNAVAISVNAKPLPPTLSMSGSTNSFCVGETFTLFAAGCSGVVNWSNGSTGISITPIATQVSSFTATCVVDGCESNNSNPIVVNVNQKPSAPQIALNSSSSSFCAGEAVTLVATNYTGTVTWSNGMTGITKSFLATSTTAFTATCSMDGCESVASNLVNVSVNDVPNPPQITLSGSVSSFCVGETVTINASGCNGTVVWNDGATGNLKSFSAATSSSFTATCTSNGCESTASNLVNITVNQIPNAPAIAVVGGSLNHCTGDNVSLTATGCGGIVNWNTGATGNAINIVVDNNTSYEATCIQNGCVSPASNSISFACPVSGNITAKIELAIKVILEGPYDAVSGLMKTVNNEQGLLPGQTPISNFSVPTAAGQPYNRVPWNYAGSESEINYGSTVVDWVLVTIRENENSVIYQTAALLHADASVEILGDNPVLDTTKQYYIQIDHRNHLGVMSPGKLSISQKRISYDFSTQNSYIKNNTPAFGQKLIAGKYVMFVGDVDKSKVSQHYDINFADVLQLRNNVGQFGQYLDADLNLDADVNFKDLIIWQLNSGKFSSVTY